MLTINFGNINLSVTQRDAPDALQLGRDVRWPRYVADDEAVGLAALARWGLVFL